MVHLRYGEIAIRTAHDSRQRPFRVQTREGTLTALGTAFTVRQFAGGTRLAVQQHAVEVVLPSGSAQRVNAGESLWFTRDRFAALVKLNGGEDSWIRGVLTFHDAPLSEVVETLARYRSGVLRCDPAVADLRLSGTFPLGDPDAILQVIAQTLPITLRSVTRYWVTLAAA